MIYLKNVASLKYFIEKCIGCKMCINVCPRKVFSFGDGKAQVVSKDMCIECGACEKNCPVNAIEVNSGVGCAAGIIAGILKGTEPTCGCGENTGCC